MKPSSAQRDSSVDRHGQVAAVTRRLPGAKPRVNVTATSGEVRLAELTSAAMLFFSLGHPTRLAIVRQLAAAPMRVIDLVESFGLAQSTVSRHLACLRDCGLVTSDQVGCASLFRLTLPALIDVLTSAETVLTATGQYRDSQLPHQQQGVGKRRTVAGRPRTTIER